jgi:hypothetical protein
VLIALKKKRVDSSSVRQKPHLAQVLERLPCGKTEEGSGKKGGEFEVGESKKAVDLSTLKTD